MDQRARLYGLAVRAGVWVWAIERLSNAAAESKMYDAHMCALALYHLKRCKDSIWKLSPPLTPEERKLLEAFSDACEKAKLKELRNALEHEEEHFSGGRPRRRTTCHQEDAGPPAIAWDSITKRLLWIYVLGVRYPIEEAADAAIALGDLLLELAERTGPNE